MSRKQKNKQKYKEKRAASMSRKRKAKVLFSFDGTVQMTREGFCFVPSGDATVGDVFVKAVKTHGALHGDKVTVDVTKAPTAKGGRYEGVITQILERCQRPFVGFLHMVGNRRGCSCRARSCHTISASPRFLRGLFRVTRWRRSWMTGLAGR